MGCYKKFAGFSHVMGNLWGNFLYVSHNMDINSCDTTWNGKGGLMSKGVSGHFTPE